MKKAILLVLLGLVFCLAAQAQGPTITLIHVQGVPTASCSTEQLMKNDLTGDIYSCLNGAPHLVSTNLNYLPIYSVTSFGAVCDGNHQAADTAAIQSAITAALNGGSVYIPVGTCQFNNSSGAYVIANFKGQIYGEGASSKIVFSTMANDGFDVNSASRRRERAPSSLANVMFQARP